MQTTFSTSMTCGNCLRKIKPLMDSEPGVARWEADLENPQKIIRVKWSAVGKSDRIIELFRQAGFEAAVISESDSALNATSLVSISPAAEKASFTLATYRPLLLVIGYVIGLATLFGLQQPHWDWHRFMTYFMGFFFLGFAFFKLLDTAKFADAFSSYDVVARRSRIYALAYPWIEVSLGLMFLTGTWLVAANLLTAVVMSVGLVGVVTAVLSQQPIQCACLGTAFNLPMSVVTIIENSVMIVMSIAMLAF